jgi:hypothetical protein
VASALPLPHKRAKRNERACRPTTTPLSLSPFTIDYRLSSARVFRLSLSRSWCLASVCRGLVVLQCRIGIEPAVACHQSPLPQRPLRYPSLRYTCSTNTRLLPLRPEIYSTCTVYILICHRRLPVGSTVALRLVFIYAYACSSHLQMPMCAYCLCDVRHAI